MAFAKTTLLVIYFFSVNICFGQSYTESMKFPACNGFEIRALPATKTLQQNTNIILEASRSYQDVLQELDKHPVYLKSGEERIKLNAIEFLTGQVYTIQVVLKPSEELIVGKNYKLYIDGYDSTAIFKRNVEGKSETPASWLVIAKTDTVKPEWLLKPVLLSKNSYQPQCNNSDPFFTCHNFECISFEYRIKSNLIFFVKATIENITTHKRCVYYIVPNKNKIELGHNECYGAFEFGKSNSFEASFDIIDVARNVTAWGGKKIKFNSKNMTGNIIANTLLY